MASFRDVAHLVNAPEFPNSVQWADDGMLAVAEGGCIAMMHPSGLSGAQAFAALEGFCQDTVIAAPGVPNEGGIHFDLSLSLRVLLSSQKESTSGGKFSAKERKDMGQNRRPTVAARSIAWSPTGVGTAGNCLLAAVTNDHRVVIFGPSNKLDPEWFPLSMLHEKLFEHLEATQWASIDGDFLLTARGIDVGDSGASDDSETESDDGRMMEIDVKREVEETLRLRGGAPKGRRKKVTVVKEEREVEEEQHKAGGADKQGDGEAEAGGPSPAEGINDAATGAAPAAAVEAPAAAAAADVEMVDAGEPREEGDVAAADGAATEAAAATAAAAAAVGASPGRGGRGRGRGGRGGRGRGGRGRGRGRSNQAKEEVKIEGELAATAAVVGARTEEGGPSTDARAPAPSPPPAPAPGGGGNRRKPAAPRPAPTGDATDRDTTGRAVVPMGLPPVAWTAGRHVKYSIAEAAVERFFQLRRSFPPEEVPTYEAKNSHLRGIDKDNLESAAAEYFAAYQEQLQEAGVSMKDFAVELRIALRKSWDRSRNAFEKGFEHVGRGEGPGGLPPELETESEDEEERKNIKEGEEGPESGGLRRTRRAGAKRKTSLLDEASSPGAGAGAEAAAALPAGLSTRAEEHGAGPSTGGGGDEGAAPAAPAVPPVNRDPFVVAEGFSWKELPPVDPTNRSTLRRGITDGAVKRFLRLRAEEPVDSLPIYTSAKQHLKGLDAWLVERVNAEYEAAHSPGLLALGYEPSKFGEKWTVRLRSLWNRKTNETIGEFDFTSDEGITHPQGDGPPVPISNKDVGGRGGGSGGGTRGRAGGRGGRGRGRGGASVSYADRYGKESLGGSVYWGGSNLNGDVYERRLLGVSALSVAWSPTILGPPLSSSSSSNGSDPLPSGGFSFLAIGTKEGRIWLWRCNHPAAPALPGTVDQERSNLEQRMSLVGRLPGNLSWAGVLKWISIPVHVAASTSTTPASVLLLVVGSSDGRVTLWGADSSTLGIADTLETPLTKWATIVAPDLVQVTSLDARLRYLGAHGTTGPQLVIAVGKSAGGLCAWVSKELPAAATTYSTLSSAADKVKSALQKGDILEMHDSSVLSSQTVSGVTLAAGAELLVACCRDGTMETWSLPRAGNTLQPSVAPMPCAKRKQKDMGFGAFGVAASPGGTFVAVARCSLPAGVDFVKQLQVWQRVTQGYLHMYRLAGPGAAMQDLFGACAMVSQAWVDKRLPPAALWDAIQLSNMQNGVALSVASPLENEYLQAQQQAEIACGGRADLLVPSVIPESAWRALRAAVTLRRAAAAIAAQATANTVLAEGSTAAGKPDQLLGLVDEGALDRDQMLLLQRQLERLLAPPGSSTPPPVLPPSSVDVSSTQFQEQLALYRLLAADCVVANTNHPNLMLGLLPLAVRAYHEAGETPPGEANAFAIPSRSGGTLLDDRPVAMSGGSAAAALTAMFHEEGQAVGLPRCPATLQVSMGGGRWACRGCSRAYNAVPGGAAGSSTGGVLEVPECVLCGGMLGPACPDIILCGPCM